MTRMQLKASKGAVLPILSSSNLRSRSEGLLADQLHLERLVRAVRSALTGESVLGLKACRTFWYRACRAATFMQASHTGALCIYKGYRSKDYFQNHQSLLKNWQLTYEWTGTECVVPDMHKEDIWRLTSPTTKQAAAQPAHQIQLTRLLMMTSCCLQWQQICKSPALVAQPLKGGRNDFRCFKRTGWAN